MIALMLVAGTASATGMYEDFQGYVIGPLCTSNPDAGWTCGSTDLLVGELLDVVLKIANKVVMIDAKSTGSATTPSAEKSFTTPATTLYKGSIRATVGRNQSATDGMFSLLQLRDANNTSILTIAFNDNDASLELSNGTGWDTDVYTMLTDANRWIDVHVNRTSQKYWVEIDDGQSVVYQKFGVGLNTNSDMRATKIRFGSLDTDDNANVHFDEVDVHEEFSV